MFTVQSRPDDSLIVHTVARACSHPMRATEVVEN